MKGKRIEGKSVADIRVLRIDAAVTGIVLCALGILYLLQRYGSHLDKTFYPGYKKVVLTEESDYETVFLQTGLGASVVDRLRAEGRFDVILEAQELFFCPREIACVPLLGWFTEEDRVTTGETDEEDCPVSQGKKAVCLPEFADLQPGDILLTLSTHSLGWRHGHAALVVDEQTTLESAVWGTDAAYGVVENWRSYADWAVLRVKGVTPKLQQQVVEYAGATLHGAPYHLSAGFIGSKAPASDKPYFGVQCAYLVWYAWNHFGHDLDGDGGRLVTAYDLMCSEKLEVVQIYGMDPQEWLVK